MEMGTATEIVAEERSETVMTEMDMEAEIEVKR